MKIAIDGKDSIGWSIDQDAYILKEYICRLGHEVVADWREADIVHNIWWNNILSRREILYSHPRVIVTCSNFVNLDNIHYELKDEFEQVNEKVKGWISPSIKQNSIFLKHGVTSFYLPFSINFTNFSPLKITRKTICEEFGIPYSLIYKRCLIGSFQRDSLGSDLLRPKWQKNPDLLVELLKDLPKDQYLLLLAGPRRHYIMKKCKEYGIPYYYIGNECEDDDLLTNSVDISRMPLLYSLLDLYLITSSSEGGPKAAIEASAMRVFVMSTDVGLAKYFIHNSFVFADTDEYKNAVHDYVVKHNCFETGSIIDYNYSNCLRILNPQAMCSQLGNIYQQICR